MEKVFIKKEDLNKWTAKYFYKDLISIEDMLDVIEQLDEDVEALKEHIEYLEQPKDNIDELVDEQILMNKGE